MRYRRSFPIAALLLGALAAPAHAEGRWCVSLSAGQSVSANHGSALDAAFYAEVHPLVGLGIETGLAYMNDERRLSRGGPIVLPVDANGGAVIGGVTDGLTRNRGYYLGPALRIGQTVYAVASAGLYDLSDNSGHSLGTRWGASGGLGLTGPGRLEPRGELRYRIAQDGSHRASAIQLLVGLQLR